MITSNVTQSPTETGLTITNEVTYVVDLSQYDLERDWEIYDEVTSSIQTIVDDKLAEIKSEFNTNFRIQEPNGWIELDEDTDYSKPITITKTYTLEKRAQPLMTGEEVLDVAMFERSNDAGAQDIRGYFKALLAKLLQDPESFSGKRPFGNSGWDRDLYCALASIGIFGGEWYVDQDNGGYGELVYVDSPDEIQDDDYNDLIQAAIDAL